MPPKTKGGKGLRHTPQPPSAPPPDDEPAAKPAPPRGGRRIVAAKAGSKPTRAPPAEPPPESPRVATAVPGGGADESAAQAEDNVSVFTDVDQSTPGNSPRNLESPPTAGAGTKGPAQHRSATLLSPTKSVTFELAPSVSPALAAGAFLDSDDEDDAGRLPGTAATGAIEGAQQGGSAARGKGKARYDPRDEGVLLPNAIRRDLQLGELGILGGSLPSPTRGMTRSPDPYDTAMGAGTPMSMATSTDTELEAEVRRLRDELDADVAQLDYTLEGERLRQQAALKHRLGVKKLRAMREELKQRVEADAMELAEVKAASKSAGDVLAHAHAYATAHAKRGRERQRRVHGRGGGGGGGGGDGDGDEGKGRRGGRTSAASGDSGASAGSGSSVDLLGDAGQGKVKPQHKHPRDATGSPLSGLLSVDSEDDIGGRAAVRHTASDGDLLSHSGVARKMRVTPSPTPSLLASRTPSPFARATGGGGGGGGGGSGGGGSASTGTVTSAHSRIADLELQRQAKLEAELEAAARRAHKDHDYAGRRLRSMLLKAGLGVKFAVTLKVTTPEALLCSALLQHVAVAMTDPRQAPALRALSERGAVRHAVVLARQMDREIAAEQRSGSGGGGGGSGSEGGASPKRAWGGGKSDLPLGTSPLRQRSLWGDFRSDDKLFTRREWAVVLRSAGLAARRQMELEEFAPEIVRRNRAKRRAMAAAKAAAAAGSRSPASVVPLNGVPAHSGGGLGVDAVRKPQRDVGASSGAVRAVGGVGARASSPASTAGTVGAGKAETAVQMLPPSSAASVEAREAAARHARAEAAAEAAAAAAAAAVAAEASGEGGDVGDGGDDASGASQQRFVSLVENALVMAAEMATQLRDDYVYFDDDQDGYLGRDDVEVSMTSAGIAPHKVSVAAVLALGTARNAAAAASRAPSAVGRARSRSNSLHAPPDAAPRALSFYEFAAKAIAVAREETLSVAAVPDFDSPTVVQDMVGGGGRGRGGRGRGVKTLSGVGSASNLHAHGATSAGVSGTAGAGGAGSVDGRSSRSGRSARANGYTDRGVPTNLFSADARSRVKFGREGPNVWPGVGYILQASLALLAVPLMTLLPALRLHPHTPAVFTVYLAPVCGIALASFLTWFAGEVPREGADAYAMWMQALAPAALYAATAAAVSPAIVLTDRNVMPREAAGFGGPVRWALRRVLLREVHASGGRAQVLRVGMDVIMAIVKKAPRSALPMILREEVQRTVGGSHVTHPDEIAATLPVVPIRGACCGSRLRIFVLSAVVASAPVVLKVGHYYRLMSATRLPPSDALSTWSVALSGLLALAVWAFVAPVMSLAVGYAAQFRAATLQARAFNVMSTESARDKLLRRRAHSARALMKVRAAAGIARTMSERVVRGAARSALFGGGGGHRETRRTASSAHVSGVGFGSTGTDGSLSGSETSTPRGGGARDTAGGRSSSRSSDRSGGGGGGLAAVFRRANLGGGGSGGGGSRGVAIAGAGAGGSPSFGVGLEDGTAKVSLTASGRWVEAQTSHATGASPSAEPAATLLVTSSEDLQTWWLLRDVLISLARALTRQFMPFVVMLVVVAGAALCAIVARAFADLVFDSDALRVRPGGGSVDDLVADAVLGTVLFTACVAVLMPLRRLRRFGRHTLQPHVHWLRQKTQTVALAGPQAPGRAASFRNRGTSPVPGGTSYSSSGHAWPGASPLQPAAADADMVFLAQAYSGLATDDVPGLELRPFNATTIAQTAWGMAVAGAVTLGLVFGASLTGVPSRPE